MKQDFTCKNCEAGRLECICKEFQPMIWTRIVSDYDKHHMDKLLHNLRMIAAGTAGEAQAYALIHHSECLEMVEAWMHQVHEIRRTMLDYGFVDASRIAKLLLKELNREEVTDE